MSEKSYFVRTCYRNEYGKLVSPSPEANGFIWPEDTRAIVEAPDWDPDPYCGHGLHGLRPGDDEPGWWAEGPTAVWIVCSYDPASAVDLKGCIKVPSCMVEYVVNETDGAKHKVPLWLRNHGVLEPIFQGEVTVGDHETAKVGKYGVAIAGDYGIAKAEFYRGRAEVGYGGTAVAGPMGTAIAGPKGTAIAGLCGKAQASIGGKIQIFTRKYKHVSVCTVTGHIGQYGLKPDTLYKLDADNYFVEVSDV